MASKTEQLNHESTTRLGGVQSVAASYDFERSVRPHSARGTRPNRVCDGETGDSEHRACIWLQKFGEFIDGQTGLGDDGLEGAGLDRRMVRHGDGAMAGLGQDDVTAGLSFDDPAGALQRGDHLTRAQVFRQTHGAPYERYDVWFADAPRGLKSAAP